jgi:hypothetical protein
MRRTAHLLKSSNILNREIWYDAETWPEIKKFFSLGQYEASLTKEQKQRQKAFRHVLLLVLDGLSTREQFEKECASAENCIWSMKFFKGSQNARIFCHHIEVMGVDRFVLAYLIPKKSMQSLDSRLRKRIEIVSNYTFDFVEDK